MHDKDHLNLHGMHSILSAVGATVRTALAVAVKTAARRRLAPPPILMAIVAGWALFVPLNVSAQNAPTEEEVPAETEAPAEAEAPEGEDAPQSGDSSAPAEAEDDEEPLIEQWRETLLYGIDSQVEELLPVLSSNRVTELNDEVEELLQSSLNPRLKTKIFEFFMEMDTDVAIDEGVEILEYHRDERPELVRATLSYLRNGDFELPPEAVEAVRPIAADPYSGFTAEAARVIGEKGGEDDVEALVGALEEAVDDELRGQLILALGDIGAPAALDALVDIARNDDEARLIRGYAADALGRIGDPEALDVLKDMVSAEDAIVRAYAVSALSRFDDPETEPTLLAALRDSVWRVRQFALQGVARNGMTDAVPAVIYKAEQDPEERVRSEAFATLVQLGTAKANTFVEEYLLDSDKPMNDRLAAAAALIEHDLSGSVNVLEKAVEAEWSATQSRLLGFIARELSQKEDEALAELYSKFLTHSEPAVQIFGLRGIGRNRVLRLKTKVEEKSDEGNHPAVRQNAETVLEQL
ncbi:MAG: HEAT repeat domain-containing protein [Spirochaetia bacterium]